MIAKKLVAVLILPRTRQLKWCPVGIKRPLDSSCTTKWSLIRQFWYGDYCKRVNKASHHSSENFRWFRLLHQRNTRKIKPAFSRATTSTDWTATKLFSSNSDGCFQQDGHQRPQLPGWRTTFYYILKEDWSPNSPDLSPIVWNIWLQLFMPAKSHKHWRHSNVLCQALRKSWGSIYLTTVQNLIGSMPDRLKGVIRNKGYTIPY